MKSTKQPCGFGPATDLQLSEGIVTLLLTRSLLGAHGDELVDAVSHSTADAREEAEEPSKNNRRTEGTVTYSKIKRKEKENSCLRRTDRAAVANWFLRLGELGSVDKALAANSSLLEDMEMVFRLDTTCV